MAFPQTKPQSRRQTESHRRHETTQRRRPIEWLAGIGLTLLLAVAFVASINTNTGNISSSAQAVAFSGGCTLLAILLIPVSTWDQRRVSTTLFWAAAISASCGLLTVLMQGLAPAKALTLAVTVFALIMALSAMRHIIGRRCDETVTSAWIFATFMLLCTTPLFLSAFAEAFSEQRWLINSIVNLSPISALAAAVDYDYLRSNWFYRYTRLGGIRFEYAASGSLIVSYGLIAAALQLLVHVHVQINHPHLCKKQTCNKKEINR